LRHFNEEDAPPGYRSLCEILTAYRKRRYSAAVSGSVISRTGRPDETARSQIASRNASLAGQSRRRVLGLEKIEEQGMAVYRIVGLARQQLPNASSVMRSTKNAKSIFKAHSGECLDANLRSCANARCNLIR
jgi:hypothetical protein